MPTPQEQLKELLIATARQNASDLHLAVGRHPTLRVDGALVPIEKEPQLTPETIDQLNVFIAKKCLIAVETGRNFRNFINPNDCGNKKN